MMLDNKIISIDEGIRHCYEVYHERNDMCKECREEHLQLAKWLEELKASRETINRQKAEIEYLQKEYIPEIAITTKRTDELAFEEMKKTARLQEEIERYKHSIRLLEKDVQSAKSEAIKELAVCGAMYIFSKMQKRTALVL